MYTSKSKGLLKSFSRFKENVIGTVRLELFPNVLPINGSVPYGVEFDRDSNQLLFNIDFNDTPVEKFYYARAIRDILESTNEDTGISLVYSGYTGDRKVIPVSAILKSGGIYLVKYGRNYKVKRRIKTKENS
jgi:hypothetical protein